MSKTYRIPFHFRLIRPVIKAAFRMLFHVLGRVKIIGKENIPYGKPYVVAMNHISIYDPPFIASFWPEILEIMGASEVFDKPGQGQLLKLYGVMPVHRGEYERSLLEKIVRILKSGYPFLIAPEGGRSHVTAMRRAHAGIGYIVDAAGVPVIPVGLVGTTDDFWHRAIRGEKPELEMGAARREARQENADQIMRYLAGLLPEDYRGVYAETAIFPTETDK